MKRSPFVLFFCLSAVLSAAAQSSSPRTSGPAPTQTAAATLGAGDRAVIDRAIAAVYPSLVRVFVVSMEQAAGREIKREGAGSGTIISPDGYVVTNHHVAGRARRIVCTLSDRQEVPADLIGTDALSDIAVLKLRPSKPRTFPVARFGSSSKLRSGDAILAMGSPLALSQSVTRGIVSNTEMIMPQVFGPSSGLGRLDGEDVGSIVRWIGHDAAIYPGNSGGPLVSLTGEIIGINEISYGLAGAIPSDLAKPVVDALIRDGRVHRSWTGIEVQPRVGDDARAGVLVSWVADDSPAAAAGVKAGDLLVRVNDAAVDVKFFEQLPPVNQLLFALPIGKPSKLVVRRGTADSTLSIVPVERPAVRSWPSELRPWGLAVANISALEAREMGRASTEGVRVVSLRPGGPAQQAKPPLERDDVIVEIEGQPVHSVAELEERTTTLLGTKSKASILTAFERGRERRLTIVDANISAPTPPPADAAKAFVPVNVQVLTPPLADRLALKGRTGVIVTRVLDDKTPLQIGDVILAVDDDPVRATAANDEDLFATTIRRYRIGETVQLQVSRQGHEMKVPIVLGRTPVLAREMKPYVDADFEFRARNLVDADRNDPRLTDAPTGVMVESVSDGGWAALARLLGGDIILAVDGHAIDNVDDLAAQMKQIVDKRPASVVLEVRRGIRTLFVEIQPTWK